jgi:hypothetical protein
MKERIMLTKKEKKRLDAFCRKITPKKKKGEYRW